ncbi:MAG: 50S ribosomal protein L28 [Candidatus Magasanikbacteria bacterium CG10_big_fil_rev_8_21_14_0_10_40_10]|uniref:Large ribosomal subunit protein bL28 n=1 Tax=Candidatus Magasanikbacteria bacterium CG10_big_fil_rev_8_21_14_0_10_40_10 TaxID=1974648 RepID=A0A2M6W356_9BACT|nr:MAG: 50S ribosomal protein L28 [Candidatus Magasanikbacteria bacterium CG10_big_fil_rev_8_21_14_0_10_40_10]
MSRSCDLCGKNANTANHVSHAQNKVKRKQRPNLQSFTVGDMKIKNVCSTCRRTMNKQSK